MPDATVVDPSDHPELPLEERVEAQLQAQEEEWIRLSFEPRRRASTSGKRRKVWYRLKTQKWLAELDNQLRMVHFEGPGLRRFQVEASWPSATIHENRCWPVLVVSADQGPDRWAGQSWADYGNVGGRICMVREPDSHNHGLHIDVVGACLELSQ